MTWADVVVVVVVVAVVDDKDGVAPDDECKWSVERAAGNQRAVSSKRSVTNRSVSCRRAHVDGTAIPSRLASSMSDRFVVKRAARAVDSLPHPTSTAMRSSERSVRS